VLRLEEVIVLLELLDDRLLDDIDETLLDETFELLTRDVVELVDDPELIDDKIGWLLEDIILDDESPFTGFSLLAPAPQPDNPSTRLTGTIRRKDKQFIASPNKDKNHWIYVYGSTYRHTPPL